MRVYHVVTLPSRYSNWLSNPTGGMKLCTYIGVRHYTAVGSSVQQFHTKLYKNV